MQGVSAEGLHLPFKCTFCCGEGFAVSVCSVYGQHQKKLRFRKILLRIMKFWWGWITLFVRWQHSQFWLVLSCVRQNVYLQHWIAESHWVRFDGITTIAEWQFTFPCFSLPFMLNNHDDSCLPPFLRCSSCAKGLVNLLTTWWEKDNSVCWPSTIQRVKDCGSNSNSQKNYKHVILKEELIKMQHLQYDYARDTLELKLKAS